MPHRDLSYGDQVDIETADGLITITKHQGGRLQIESPHSVRVNPVRKRIKSRPRMQPNARVPIEIAGQ